jgi:hypothetical protein
MDYWSLLYLVLLVMAFIPSIFLKDKTYLLISSVLLLGFALTRVITEFTTGPRFMFDMSNDLFIVVLLLVFTKKSLVSRGIIACYALMTLFGYIPSIMGYISIHTNHIFVDIFAFIQIVILFWGINNGYRKSKSINSRVDVNPYVFGGGGVVHNLRPNRLDKEFKSGTHAHLAKDS